MCALAGERRATPVVIGAPSRASSTLICENRPIQSHLYKALSGVRMEQKTHGFGELPGIYEKNIIIARSVSPWHCPPGQVCDQAIPIVEAGDYFWRTRGSSQVLQCAAPEVGGRSTGEA